MGTITITDSMADPETFIEEYKGKHISVACKDLGIKADELICKTETATLHMRRGGNEYHKIPNMAILASNLLKTGVAVAADGLKEAENQVERFLTCKRCPQYIESSDRCSICGCYVAMKIRYEASHCPKEKW